MWFWWFLFVCNLIYPITMILAGRLMWKHCANTMSDVMGYRSKRSMRNKDTWKFANENCGKRWWNIGWILLAPTVLVQLPLYGKSKEAIGSLALVICVVECTILLASILPTERALKATFTEDGTRKQ